MCDYRGKQFENQSNWAIYEETHLSPNDVEGQKHDECDSSCLPPAEQTDSAQFWQQQRKIGNTVHNQSNDYSQLNLTTQDTKLIKTSSL